MINNSSINIIAFEKTKRAEIFLDRLNSHRNKNDKIQALVDMMTYYDKINANNFQGFCIDLLNDKGLYSRDCKLTEKIKELQDIKDIK